MYLPIFHHKLNAPGILLNLLTINVKLKLVAKLKRSFSENQMFYFNGQCFTLENVNDICIGE